MSGQLINVAGSLVGSCSVKSRGFEFHYIFLLSF